MSKLIAVVTIILSTTLVSKSQYPQGENYYYNEFWKPDSIMTDQEFQGLFRKGDWDAFIQHYSLGQETDTNFQSAYNKASEKLNYRLSQTYSIYEMANMGYNPDGTPAFEIKKAIKVIKKTIIENLDNGQYRVSLWGKLQFVN